MFKVLLSLWKISKRQHKKRPWRDDLPGIFFCHFDLDIRVLFFCPFFDQKSCKKSVSFRGKISGVFLSKICRTFGRAKNFSESEKIQMPEKRLVRNFFSTQLLVRLLQFNGFFLRDHRINLLYLQFPLFDVKKTYCFFYCIYLNITIQVYTSSFAVSLLLI